MTTKSLEDMTVDELLAHAKAMQPFANTFTSLTSNPETRETIQRAMKKINPKLSIPEIDAKDSVRDEIKAERDARLKLEERIQTDEIKRSIEARKAKATRDYGLTEADLIEVEKLMLDPENPIPTYDAAARVFKASKVSATPTPSTLIPPVYTLSEGKDDPFAKGMFGNAPGGGGAKARLDHAGMNAAFEAMNEIMGGKVPGLGSAKAN
jgi:hypothetical protein